MRTPTITKLGLNVKQRKKRKKKNVNIKETMLEVRILTKLE